MVKRIQWSTLIKSTQEFPTNPGELYQPKRIFFVLELRRMEFLPEEPKGK